MHIPNEILNIIFSYVERPKYFKILNEIISKYNLFLKASSICQPLFYKYFFRVFLQIWKKWPENYPKLLKLQSDII